MIATRLDAFRQEIERAGLTPPATIIADGKLHRFASNGDRADDAGWYIYFPDETPAGVFGCWRTNVKQTWSGKADSTLTAAERERQRTRFDEARRQREQDERLRHAEAAKRAQQLWDRTKLAPVNHPYLIRKGIQLHDLRVDDENRLIVPVTIDGSLASLQFIDAHGGKQFLPGGKVRGGTFTIGSLSYAGPLLLCEGFATGASLHEAADLPVVVAFYAGNLRPVAEHLRQQLPTATIVVCGDHDLSGTGQRAAREAADAINGVVTLPGGQGQDFNDVHVQLGLDAVRVYVKNATSQATVTPEGSTAAGRALFRRVADVQARPIRWLWPGRIARGKVSIIAGNPGLGKSQVTVGMAATVSTGGRWPVDGQGCEVGNVIILSAEDDPSDTIRPRLEAAGADLSRAYILDAVLDRPLSGSSETPRAFNLKTDIDQLESMLKAIGGAALVIIDPITAYLGTTDSHKNAEIRALLSPLAELAGRYGAAVVAVSHFNKNANTEALMRVTGSLAFVAAARAAYVVAKDPENDARRLFLPLKNNLGNDQTGLAFTVESAQVESARGMIETSRVVWESSAVVVTAEEAMKPQAHDEERSDLEDAKGFLRELLANGPVPSKQIETDAKGAGHAWRTIQRAQKILGIVAVKRGMKEGWVWQFGPEECQEPPKNAVPGVWQPSYSSGGLGGLQGSQAEEVDLVN
ncbi:MAG: AAA family ATPase [Nitrospira sp.]|nr:AAA family ATPase [Nitrospira sp.]